MDFRKPHRREPTEPQLAAMIDVFSILIIFLIAGTAMDSSVLEIPGNLLLPESTSKATTVNSPQVTLVNGILDVKFINEKLSIAEIEEGNIENPKLIRISAKLKFYLKNLSKGAKRTLTNLELLQSINLVADKDTPYKNIFTTIKYFRSQGFLNSILVGTDHIEKSK